jgi:hypothetical protein
MSKVVALLSEPRYADEDRTRKANRTQRSRRLGRTPSTDGWPTANKRRRLAIGCGREDATADMRRVRVPCDCDSFRGDDCRRVGACQARRDGHIGSRRHWRPGWPLSLRLRLAAPAAPQTAPRCTLRRGLRRTRAHSGALTGSTQAAIRQQSGSNHEQSVALGRPTPSPHAVVLGEGAAATVSDCLAIFMTTLRKLSRIVICMR